MLTLAQGKIFRDSGTRARASIGNRNVSFGNCTIAVLQPKNRFQFVCVRAHPSVRGSSSTNKLVFLRRPMKRWHDGEESVDIEINASCTVTKRN